ncbi:hypothetical protein PIB30_044039, partial [Stylosanthes scabra]|nr:hypothetical protein [Stylosanthes scabra]
LPSSRSPIRNLGHLSLFSHPFSRQIPHRCLLPLTGPLLTVPFTEEEATFGPCTARPRYRRSLRHPFSKPFPVVAVSPP